MAPMPRVVFVCLHGSAKSVIAAEQCQRLARERGLVVEAMATGVEPDAEIPLPVIRGLLAEGIDVRGRRPRRVSGDDLAAASRVVAFGCDLTGVAAPGVPIERWDDVPAVSEDFGAARDAIVAHLRRLLSDMEGEPGSE